jgi:hypothetical protein
MLVKLTKLTLKAPKAEILISLFAFSMKIFIVDLNSLSVSIHSEPNKAVESFADANDNLLAK